MRLGANEAATAKSGSGGSLWKWSEEEPEVKDSIYDGLAAGAVVVGLDLNELGDKDGAQGLPGTLLLESSKLRLWIEEALQQEREDLSKQVQGRHSALLDSFDILLQANRETGAKLSIVPVECGDAIILPGNLPETQTSSAADGVVPPDGGKAMPQKVSTKIRTLLVEETDGTAATAKSNRGYLDWVDGPTFEATFAVAIVMNTLVMAFQVQYGGIDAGFKMGYPGSFVDAETAWPGASRAFDVLEIFFGLIFCVEIMLKLLSLRARFALYPWNWFDTLIVGFWVVDQLVETEIGINPMVFRLFRLARLMRILRLVKYIAVFGPLTLMIKAISASTSTLLWTVVILVVVQMACAMFLSQSLEGFLSDPVVPADKKIAVYSYFGTFSRAFLTTFEMTLANWVPPCRVLVENVSEWYACVFLVYKASIGFAVLSIITGVFLHETFKVLYSDNEVMIMQKANANAAFLSHLQDIFLKADESGDGWITWDEFEPALHEPKMKAWLAALELEIPDLEELFRMLDDGDGRMSNSEFISGIKRVKGGAKSIDVAHLLHDTQRLSKLVWEIASKLGVDPPVNLRSGAVLPSLVAHEKHALGKNASPPGLVAGPSETAAPAD